MRRTIADIAKSLAIVLAVCGTVYVCGLGLLILAMRNNSVLKPSLLERLLGDDNANVALSENRMHLASVVDGWWLTICIISFAMAAIWICYTHFLRPGFPRAAASARGAWYIFCLSGIALAGIYGYRMFYDLALAAAMNSTFLVYVLVATSLSALLSYIVATALAVKPELRGSALLGTLMPAPGQ